MRYLHMAIFMLIGLNTIKAQNVKPTDLFIAKPYIQIGRQPTPTSLDILWHVADVNADWAVEVHNTGSTAWVKTPVPA